MNVYIYIYIYIYIMNVYIYIYIMNVYIYIYIYIYVLGMIIIHEPGTPMTHSKGVRVLNSLWSHHVTSRMLSSLPSGKQHSY